MMRSGKTTEFLVDYLATCSRSSMRRSIFDEDPDYVLVLDRMQDMLQDCHNEWAKHAAAHSPIVNSVRINILKLLTGLKGRGRDKLLAEGLTPRPGARLLPKSEIMEWRCLSGAVKSTVT